MSVAAIAPGRVAVITGAASGIGLAAAVRFAGLGMRVGIVDTDGEALDAARAKVAGAAAGGAADVLAVRVDVADAGAVGALKESVYARFGEVALLMNNAVTRVGGGCLASPADWRRAIDVNLVGVLNGVQAFVPAMIAQGTPGLVVNVGSKQGITSPPGNTAYNVCKAGVKALTEGLQHDLRNVEGGHVSAHLLVPGWTTTAGRARQPGAWLPDQVIDRMLEALARGDFYIVCPDGEVTPEMDRKRILWAAGDVTENRPPLSRWHPDWAEAFERFDP